MRHRTLLVLALCAAAGCKSSSKEAAKSEGAPTAAAFSDAAAAPVDPAGPTAPSFEIDGVELQLGPLADDLELLSIKSLPPVESWSAIIARSQDGREFRGGKPILLTGVRTMKLVKLPTGYEFRVMDQNDAGPYVRHKMSAIRRVIIYTKDYQPPPTPVPSLLLKTSEGETSVSSEMMDAIPKNTEPNGEEQRDTWKLNDLLRAHGGAEATSLVLRNADGQEVTLTRAELVDPGWLHMIKRNRRGAFNYRAWKLSEPASKETELRGVSHIEVR